MDEIQSGLTVRRMQPATASQERAGERLGQQLGNYQLIRLLAQGGFAQVYLGEHVHLGTYAAIKVLNTQLSSKELRPFRDEARMVARLRHPHIVSILDFDVQDGAPFIVMDYAPNGTLRQRHPRGSILPPATIEPYLKQTAEALQHAHNQRLVHRDVKPENMLIGWNGEILLSDFGIAVALQTTLVEMPHDVIGTLAYMSPEQFQGRGLLASDQYSLGVVAYEWLCGRCPFEGSVEEVAACHLHTPPPSLCERNSQIPPQLEQVVLRAMAKDPAQRYPSVLAFAEAFTQACPQPVVLLRDSGMVVPDFAPTSVGEQYQSETVAIPPSAYLPATMAGGQGLVRVKNGNRHVRGRRLFLGILGAAVLGVGGASAAAYLDAHGYRLTLPSLTSSAQPTPSTTKPTATPTPAVGGLQLAYHNHSDVVSTLAWQPQSGNLIASGSWDHSVRVWNASTGVDTRVFTDHTDRVNAVAWSPDGNKIASASDDNTVQIWSATQNGTAAFVYNGHQSNVNAVSWSPDGNRIASASNDRTVQVWLPNNTNQDDGNQGNGTFPTGTYRGHNNNVNAVAWSPDGNKIASGGNGLQLHVWSAQDGNDLIDPLPGHTAPIRSIAWSPDGQFIASAGADRTVRIWNVANGGGSLQRTYRNHGDVVNSVAWSTDGKYLASASSDGTVQVWRFSDGGTVFTYRGHSTNGTRPVYTVAWSPAHASIASGGSDRTAQVWTAAIV